MDAPQLCICTYVYDVMMCGVLLIYFFAIISSQDLEDLSFGDEHSLDIATWNIEWFPKNNQITVDYVIEIVNLLEFDILGIQELDDTTMFNEMLDSLPSYTGYYESSWFAGLAYIYKNDLVELIINSMLYIEKLQILFS